MFDVTSTFVICLLIIKLEFDVFRIDTFFFGNLEYIPAFARFLILATLTLNVELFPVEGVAPPPFTPVTFAATRLNSINSPLPLTVSTRLKIGTVPPSRYAIIASVLTPT